MRKLTDDELQFIIGRVMTYALEAAEEARGNRTVILKTGGPWPSTKPWTRFEMNSSRVTVI